MDICQINDILVLWRSRLVFENSRTIFYSHYIIVYMFTTKIILDNFMNFKMFCQCVSVVKEVIHSTKLLQKNFQSKYDLFYRFFKIIRTMFESTFFGTILLVLDIASVKKMKLHYIVSIY